MSVNSDNAFYVGSFITSLVGGVLLLFTDFAGWNGSNYYLGIYSFGFVGPNLEEPLSILPFLAIAALLFYGTYISYLGIQSGDVPVKQLNQAFLASGIALIVIVIGAIIFVVSMLTDEPDEWWFDAGFYGGLIGSVLTVILLYQAKKNKSL